MLALARTILARRFGKVRQGFQNSLVSFSIVLDFVDGRVGSVHEEEAAGLKGGEAFSFGGWGLADDFHHGGEEMFGGLASGVVEIFAAGGRRFEEEDELDFGGLIAASEFVVVGFGVHRQLT